MKKNTQKTARQRIISAEDVRAKRRELAEMEAAFDKQEMDKLVRAARVSGLDLSNFSETQVVEALRGLQHAFPRPVVSGEPAGAGAARVAVAGKAKATAHG